MQLRKTLLNCWHGCAPHCTCMIRGFLLSVWYLNVRHESWFLAIRPSFLAPMRVGGGWVHCKRRWVMIWGVWQPCWLNFKTERNNQLLGESYTGLTCMFISCNAWNMMLKPQSSLELMASKAFSSRLCLTCSFGRSLGFRLPQISPLNRASYWKFAVRDKSQCLVPLGNTTDDIISCTINFAICHSLQDGALCPGQNSSICQEVELTNGTVHYDMGTYDPTHTYRVLGRFMLALFHSNSVEWSVFTNR